MAKKTDCLIYRWISLPWILFLLFESIGCAQTGYLFSTVAGGGLPNLVPSSLNASLNLDYRQILTVDASGNLYFASSNGVFKRSASSGVVTRIAGATSSVGFSGDGGPALLAVFNHPSALAVDSAGNIYVADQFNNRVRKIDLEGTISTVAGTGFQFPLGDGGLAVNATLYGPTGLAIAPDGSLIISDTINYRIRKVAPNGIITTIAGNGFGGYSGDGGPATATGLYFPAGIAADTAGNVFIADLGNQRIRKVAANGTISTVAGTGNPGSSGDGGPAVNAELNSPAAVAVSSTGDVYVSDDSSRIRRVDSTGTISTFAGTGVDGFSGDGGLAVNAELELATAMVFDSTGTFYFADSFNGRIRTVAPNGIINTIVGNGIIAYSGDGGPALGAQLGQPFGVALGPDGSIYVASTYNHTVRKVSTSGIISTFAGSGYSGFSGDSGPAAAATLNQPNSIAIDGSGNIFISDSQNFRVRRVDAITGVITTVAGNGSFIESGDGLQARFAGLSPPRAIAFDTGGNLLIGGDSGRVRKIGVNGIITTVAGNGNIGDSGDGGPATGAQIHYASGLASDGAGGFYIFEGFSFRVRHVTANGNIATVAGNGNYGFSGDGGQATAAQFAQPNSGLLDAAGNLFIVDGSNYRIRKVATNGVVTTAAGNGTQTYAGDGVAANSTGMGFPSGIAMDPVSGALLIIDGDSGVIRVLTAIGGKPVLLASKSHNSAFPPGLVGGIYNVTVRNPQLAGPTSGTVTVTELIPAGLTLRSMSGSGWTCAAPSCSRSDVLLAGNQYPPITVTVDVSPTAPEQVLNMVNVTGGGSFSTSAIDVNGVMNVPTPPVLLSPADLAAGVSTSASLSWSTSPNAVYDVDIGTGSPPVLAGTVAAPPFVAQGLAIGTTYYWRVVAKNAVGSAVSPTFSFTTQCGYSINPTSATLPPAGGSNSVNVTASFSCSWNAVSNAPWLTITSGASGAGDGGVGYSAAPNTTGVDRSGTLTIAGRTFTINQAAVVPTNYISKFLNAGTVVSSAIYETNGFVGIATTNPLISLDVRTGALPQMGIAGTTDYLTFFASDVYGPAIYWDPAKDMRFGKGGASLYNPFGFIEQMRIQSSTGNVGIGTQAPGSKLDVAGDLNLSGSLRYVGIPWLQQPGGAGANLALGLDALGNRTTGTNNIAIGNNAALNVVGGNSNNIHIGSFGSGGDSGTIRIGNGQTSLFAAGVRGMTTGANNAVGVVIDSNGQLGTVSSSRRFKEDVEEMGVSQDLLRLKPVLYRYTQPFADGTRPIQYGLIAEDVEKVFPNLVAHSAGGRIETVKYQVLSPMLLNGIQRQQAELRRLQHEIDDEQQLKESLLERIVKLETALSLISSTQKGPLVH